MLQEFEEMIAQAKEGNLLIITTVEAFYKEPELLYKFLLRVANEGISVHFAPIETTDKV